MYLAERSTISRSTQLAGASEVVRLRHFQQIVEQDQVDPKKWKRGKIVPLQPDIMNPGFIDTSYEPPGRVDLDFWSKGLQPCLEELLKREFPMFLAGGKAGGASPCDNVRVALVNLTGSSWFRPELALWGGTYPMEAASVGKLLAVYALYQLRFDLRVLAFLNKPTDSSKLRALARASWQAMLAKEEQPALDELFDWDTWNGNPDSLNFNKRTQDRLIASIRCSDNCAMGRLMIQIGFPFIGSVAWQSGLWEPFVRGGLWLSATFDGKADVQSGCPPPESCAGINRSGTRNPVGEPKQLFAHNATALSVATFYTLLSQYRLVEPWTSIDMMTLLEQGCATGFFRHLVDPAQNITTRIKASKCGALPEFRNRLKIYGCKDPTETRVTSDSALLYDASVDPPRRYVLVLMSYIPRMTVDGIPAPKGDMIHHWDYRKLLPRLERLLRYKAEDGAAC